METDILLKIFFTITAAGFIVVTLLIGVAIIYVISVVRSVRRLARLAETTANALKDDVLEMRSTIKSKGLSFMTLASFFKKVASKSRSSRK